jgi:hypothetical protein
MTRCDKNNERKYLFIDTDSKIYNPNDSWYEPTELHIEISRKAFKQLIKQVRNEGYVSAAVSYNY